MSTIKITLSQLRGMIGQTVIVDGKHYLVIEVLEDDTELVLQDKNNCVFYFEIPNTPMLYGACKYIKLNNGYKIIEVEDSGKPRGHEYDLLIDIKSGNLIKVSNSKTTIYEPKKH